MNELVLVFTCRDSFRSPISGVTSIQFNSDICTRQLINNTLARTAKKKL